ncbi:hypothetical protein [Exiguobacterium sp. s39]|uniref:hypothetical protein n=1 Tax=Exiguobacterium sp. s39 TaxID=2751198 RepID=UPI001BEC3B4D|nr:hypothetical protein [Exiguobacterium sp. s39]
MSIIYTKKFEHLSEETKEASSNKMNLLEKHNYTPYLIDGSRSDIENISFNNENLILKVFTAKGKQDQDIEALLKLEDSSFYPTLYAYKKNHFLLMEKVNGISLEELLINKKIDLTQLKIIKEQYLLSVHEAASKYLDNVDKKLDQIFWDSSQKKLKVIDLGFFEQFFIQVQTLEDVIQESSSWFDEETSYYI